MVVVVVGCSNCGGRGQKSREERERCRNVGRKVAVNEVAQNRGTTQRSQPLLPHLRSLTVTSRFLGSTPQFTLQRPVLLCSALALPLSLMPA